MPRALNRRNRSVHLAVILILAAIVYGFLVYHPESDRDAENFSTQDLQIKHHLTTPTPIVQSIESLQPSHKAIRTKHAHELQPIETPSPVVSVPDQKYSNQTVVPCKSLLYTTLPLEVGSADSYHSLRQNLCATLQSQTR